MASLQAKSILINNVAFSVVDPITAFSNTVFKIFKASSWSKLSNLGVSVLKNEEGIYTFLYNGQNIAQDLNKTEAEEFLKEVILHTNFSKKKLNNFLIESKINRQTSTLEDAKKVYKYMLSEGHIKYDMHPFIENRLKVHFEKLGQSHKGIKKSSNYTWRQTGDLPGIHAEVLSLNELLWKLETKGYKVNDKLLNETVIGFNRNILRNKVMIRCGDCNFITFGVKFIEKFI